MDSNSPMVGTITGPAHQERAPGVPGTNDFGDGFEAIFALRQKEADEFYDSRIPKDLSEDARHVMRQAYAGMLWCKQFYHYDVHTWLEGDPAGPDLRPKRLHGRNKDWTHLYNDDIISMPDKWEYPWYAAWDLAFHCIPLAIDRSGLRQRPAHPSSPRMVHASQRAIARLRMGFRRCEPASARLGRLARLQN